MISVPAVVLARGLGTRMRAAGAELDPAAAAVADSGVKALIPDGRGRPFLDHLLTDLADAGVAEAILVIGPEHAALRDRYADAGRRIRVRCAVQERPLGTADAVAAAAPALAGRDFLVINGDNRYPAAALAALIELGRPGLVGFRRSGLLAGNIPAERIARFAAIAADGRGRLAGIIEKPDAAILATLGTDPLLSMNCWRFAPGILADCRAVRPSRRGELELPDAVACSLGGGTAYQVVESREPVLDLSCRDDVAAVRAVLDRREVVL